jgi:hypothetical protein
MMPCSTGPDGMVYLQLVVAWQPNIFAGSGGPPGLTRKVFAPKLDPASPLGSSQIAMGRSTAGAQGRPWALTLEPWSPCKVFSTIFVTILTIVHDSPLGRMENSTYMDFLR